MTSTNYALRTAIIFAAASSLLLFGVATAFAASDNAITNESFVQGLQKNGAVVDPLRSNPAEALGATDGAFVSLGYGGELVVGFAQNMSGNLLLAVQEVTGGAYPLETANVSVSTSPTGPWTLVGEATNEEGLGDGVTSLTVDSCYQYVQITDTTDGDLHNATSDGFDIDSLTANYDENCPAVVDPNGMDLHSHTHISLHSSAIVMNEADTAANTGNNVADGSYAGGAGNGGDIDNSGGEQDVEGATTGAGGTGGNAGLGGAVQTGNALAVSDIANTVNSNVVRVGDCACEGSVGRVRIRTHDFAFVGNRAMTAANSGDNEALGSYAGEGGNGGAIENGNGQNQGNQESRGNEEGNGDADQEVDDSITGAGGNGGSSDAGGSVLTGTATTRATIVNLVNSNRIRIR